MSPTKRSKTGKHRATTGLAGILARLSDRFVARAGLVLVLGAAVTSVSAATYFAWQRYAPQIAQREEYWVRPDAIQITPRPSWVHSDVLEEVIRDSGLGQGFSILDQRLRQRLIDSFELHPWIKQVVRIEKRLPAAVDIEVTYRRPFAAVEVVRSDQTQLVPIDAEAVRLPYEEPAAHAIRSLPRIRGEFGEPLPGQPFDDPRVQGAVALVNLLASEWNELGMVDVLPSAKPEVRAEHRHYTYELVSRSRTRVIWGAAPGEGPPEERSPEDKLQQLRRAVRETGPWETMKQPPEVVNVRDN